MAFVNELVPEEDKKTRFDPNVFYKPIDSYHRPIEVYAWTIDRDRDIFLIRLGGGPEQPEYFAMSWKGQVVKFRAYVNLTHNADLITYTAHWDIDHLETPTGLKDQRDEVLKLLVEGLNAMGNSICDHNGITTVNVTLSTLMTEAESL